MTSGKPPQLPPRPTPPALPPRPGTSTSASLVRPAQHETSSKAENTASKVPVPSESSIALSSTTTGSSDDSFQSNLAGDLSITIPGKPADPEETAVPPETVDVPAITHTAASSPECEGAQRFALSRSSSNSSLHSIASCSSGSGPVKPRSNPESQRPFLQLYGKLTAEQQYHAALEELQALEVVGCQVVANSIEYAFLTVILIIYRRNS